MNTIEQIKAEVERRIKEDYSSGDERDETAQGVCASLLSFLDTLKEQPVCEGLEEEIYNYANTIAEGTPLFEIIPQTARHFAKWQKEQMMMRAYTSSVAELNGMLYFSMPFSMYHRHKEIIDSGIVKLIIKED